MKKNTTIDSQHEISKAYKDLQKKLKQFQLTNVNIAANPKSFDKLPFIEENITLEKFSSPQLEDMKDLGVITNLNVPFKDGSLEGSVLYTSNSKLYSIQITQSLEQEIEKFIQRFKKTNDFYRIIKKVQKDNNIADYDNAKVFDCKRITTENKDLFEYNILRIPVKNTDDDSVGEIIYNTGNEEIEIVMNESITLRIKNEQPVRIAEASSFAGWMNCMKKCVCSNSEQCMISVIGCIGACTSCTSWVTCLPCFGCVSGISICGNECIKPDSFTN